MAPRSYHPLIGMKLGLGPNGLLYNQRPVGAQPAGMGRGNTIFLDSTVATGTGESPHSAVRTSREAMALCEPNQGDVIAVDPGHQEVITVDSGFAHIKPGVSIIGLGIGSQRPRFILDGNAAASYLISADDALLQNLVFVAAQPDMVAAIEVTGKCATLVDVEVTGAGPGKSFLTAIRASSATDNNADGLTVIDCRGIVAEFIQVNADLDRLRLTGNVIGKDLIRLAPGKRLTNHLIEGNRSAGTLSAAKGAEAVFGADGVLRPAVKAA